MNFLSTWMGALAVIIIMMTLLWIVSVIKKDASIVDPFWGTGFAITSLYYFLSTETNSPRNILILALVAVWGLRLSLHLLIRNYGKGEDFRYRNFRKKYGEERYWWVSFFQVYLLQGILMWLISVTILGGMAGKEEGALKATDYIALAIWLTGFVFEAGGDWQLARFRADASSKGKILRTGFWKYTRHPNYFGDSAVWWGFAVFSISSGNWYAIAGSVIMTILLLRVSGVTLLEKTLAEEKPGYREYMSETSSFIPWFPRKRSKLQ